MPEQESVTASNLRRGSGQEDDGYARTAPYYDLLASSFWAELAPALTATLAGVDPKAGPLVDLGAGTGRSSFVALAAVPGAELWAVEPAASMRAFLLSHLALRPDLHERITVVASDVGGLEWPEQVAAVVACNMIGHLDAAERAGLWAALSDRLGPGAPAVVGLQPPSRPERIDATAMASVRIGRHAYEGWAEAEPTGPRSLRWRMTYRTVREEEVIEESVNTFDWWTLSSEDLVDECGEAGLAVTPAAAGLLVLRRR